jgi:hypothetical protein
MGMQRNLTDIIDLDFLVSLDDNDDNQAALHACLERDRKIYQQIGSDGQTESDLIWAWFEIRKKAFVASHTSMNQAVLPGVVFSAIYRWMVMVLIISGLAMGCIAAGSFLAYHGSQPINVTVFLALFVIAPFVLSVFSIAGLLFRRFSGRSDMGTRLFFTFQTLLESICFNLLPKAVKRIKKSMPDSWGPVFDMDYLIFQHRMKSYQGLFFYPFFNLATVFAVMFSTGTLGSVLFKILVSDMAFGWQSTLITSAQTVHELVSIMALPWSFIFSDGISFPLLEQIQGSRIILKDGIAVLATPDLISWWPFLCLSVWVYAVLPRLFLLGGGFFALHRRVKNYQFLQPGYRQLITRMTAPVVSVDSTQAIATFPDSMSTQRSKQKKGPRSLKIGEDGLVKALQKSALLVASNKVYDKAAVSRVKTAVQDLYGSRIHQVVEHDIHSPQVVDELLACELEQVDPVIILYEAWQPPIRGLMHAISQLRQALPESVSLWVLLTNPADQDHLALQENDAQFAVWQKTIQAMDTSIAVKRMMQA